MPVQSETTTMTSRGTAPGASDLAALTLAQVRRARQHRYGEGGEIDPAFKFTGLPNLRLLPDAPVPDGRTVLLGPPATTGSRSVGAGGIHRLSYQ
jgi:hypothetical protein